MLIKMALLSQRTNAEMENTYIGSSPLRKEGRELVPTKTLYILDKQPIYDNYSLYRFQFYRVIIVSDTEWRWKKGHAQNAT